MIATPAISSTPAIASDPAATYVWARAASISGNHAQAAELYAKLATSSSESGILEKAVREAISAGNMPLALRLIRSAPQPPASIDSKLLVVADALRRGQSNEAITALTRSRADGDLSFWVPLVQAWNAAERRDASDALGVLGRVPPNSALGPFVDEQTALVLLKLGRSAQAEPFARRAVGRAGPRESRVRIALAAGFEAAGDRARALAMIEGIDGNAASLRRALESGQLKSGRVDTAAKAFSEQMVALALEMRRSNPRGAPVNILQVAHYAAPQNSSAAVLLGRVLDNVDRTNDALSVLRSVPRDDAFYSDALDAQTRALTGAKRFDEAIQVARTAVQSSQAGSDDFARLGDVYAALDRHNEAADAYQQAIARAQGARPERMWPLYLLRASALEQADRWPEAKAILGEALRIAPDQPLILNFLGYSKLERGEDLDTAEALIRKANKLAPDDASITDSLGWALYKRGRIEEAIEVLEQAAAGDPAQSEIHEHLGDALYAAGRRFEARFAWSAALATADDEVAGRIKSKINAGLTPATAAP